MIQTAFTPYETFFIEYIRNTTISNMMVQHYHDTYEVYLQILGERDLFLDDICHTLKRGDLVILKPFEIHYTQHHGPACYERYVMNFSLEPLSFLLTPLELRILTDRLVSCVKHLDESQTVMLLDYFTKVDFFYNRKGLFADKLLYSALFQLLMMIIALSETTELVTTKIISPEIVTVIHHLNEHYDEFIDLDTLSEMVHLSKYHLSRQFRKMTGATLMDYLYNIRLTKVHKMLVETDLTLKDISTRTGFTSTAHLSRIFRSVYSMSPRAFRKSSKEK